MAAAGAAGFVELSRCIQTTRFTTSPLPLSYSPPCSALAIASRGPWHRHRGGCSSRRATEEGCWLGGDISAELPPAPQQKISRISIQAGKELNENSAARPKANSWRHLPLVPHSLKYVTENWADVPSRCELCCASTVVGDPSHTDGSWQENVPPHARCVLERLGERGAGLWLIYFTLKSEHVRIDSGRY
jgi:hypothetical protein